MKYLVSLSGGKDSTACLLWALDTFPKVDIVPYYIDTKWEHDDVYKYLSYLEKTLDINIIRIISEGMEALSKRKKMMPNRYMRFCTENLKSIPAAKFYYDEFILKGIDFINIIGVRREESSSRADTECFKINQIKIEKEKFFVKTLFPIAYWDTQRVFDFHKSHKIDVNPLYKKGFKRVGCYPCIYAGKTELSIMEQTYKDRLRALENDITDIVKNGTKAKFFHPHVDKHLRKSLDLDFGDYCVNQFGICE